MQNIAKKSRSKIKEQILFNCEKLTLGLCTKRKIYLLLPAIYVLSKASLKDPFNIKGIKDPHSHSP